MQSYRFDTFKICIHDRNMEYCEKKKKITLVELILILNSKINLSYFNDQFVFLEKYVYFFISREMNDKSIFSFKFVNISNRINIL